MAKPAHIPVTKTDTKDPPRESGPLTHRVTAEGKQMTVVSIGGVTVEVPTPTAAELQERLAESARAMRAFAAAIPRRGVRLDFPPTIPLFEADAKDPTLVVRKLGKVRTLGRFDKNGRFIRVKR